MALIEVQKPNPECPECSHYLSYGGASREGSDWRIGKGGEKVGDTQHWLCENCHGQYDEKVEA